MSDKNSSNAMWGGRFASGPDAIMEAINASIGFDKRMAAQDIAGSIAHSAMLAKQNIITDSYHISNIDSLIDKKQKIKNILKLQMVWLILYLEVWDMVELWFLH